MDVMDVSEDFGDIEYQVYEGDQHFEGQKIPEVYEDFGDIECQVYEDEHFEGPKDYYGSKSCSIKFNVTFTLIPSYEEDSNFDFLNDWESLETGQEEHVHSVDIDKLTTFHKDSRWILVDLLESIQVPPGEIIIRGIKDCARNMASHEKYKDQRVIGMVVDLNILRVREAPSP